MKPWTAFETRASGKWVLAGEHSVLRGATAVALPHPEFRLLLTFTPSSGGLQVQPPTAERVICDILESVRDDVEANGGVFRMPEGKLEIQSTIPVGAGLGSSAALCVAMGRWLREPLGLPEGDQALFEFATRLEHRFHGRSSGMDVAVITAREPISFMMKEEGGGATSLGVKKLPRFTFHDTKLRCRTSECVVRVEKFREENPVLGQKMDDAMGAASRMAMEGLIRYDADPSFESLNRIAQAMKQAQECFYTWQLIPGEAKRLEDDLMAQGALAVKITGAGGGGMVVALWPNQA